MEMSGWGGDSVITVLLNRGQLVVGQGDPQHILLPQRLPGERVLSGEDFIKFYELFGHRSFRQITRRIIAGHGALVGVEELEKFAGSKASIYVEFLASLGVVRVERAAVALLRMVNNIGPTLEWYVAQLCDRELAGSSAWGVKLDELPAGGDYDVLAWLPPVLMYVETKTAFPSNVSDAELRNFLQRGDDLAAGVAVLLVDTTDDLTTLLSRLFELMLPPMRKSGGISDELWRPDEQFISPQSGFPGISWGARRFYVTNAKPSILQQLRRVLRHYHSRVKGTASWAGRPINWISGQVADH